MRAYVFTTMDLLDKISPAEGIFNNEFASVKGFPRAGSLNAANAKVPISTTQSAAV